jgi:hypothetical protein
MSLTLYKEIPFFSNINLQLNPLYIVVRQLVITATNLNCLQQSEQLMSVFMCLHKPDVQSNYYKGLLISP